MRPYLIAFAILLFCFLNITDYLFVWNYGPLEDYSRLVLVIWLTPIALYYLIKRRFFEPNPYLLALALIFTTAGILGSMNTFQYLGFATAISAFLPFTLTHLIWIACSISWMPALAWFIYELSPHSLLPARFFLSSLSALLATVATLRRSL